MAEVQKCTPRLSINTGVLVELRRERDRINRMRTQKVEAERQLVFEDQYEQGTRRQSMVGEVIKEIKASFVGMWKWMPLALIGLFVVGGVCLWIGTALND